MEGTRHHRQLVVLDNFAHLLDTAIVVAELRASLLRVSRAASSDMGRYWLQAN